MADDGNEFITESLDDYLLALADGIYRAQRALSRMSVELQPGRPSVTYELPKVEFELRMSYEMSGGSIRVRPADGLASSSSARSLEASSLIKGSFVAVPALGGKPAPVVSTSIARISMPHGGFDPSQYEVVVTASDTTGAHLEGREVVFDIDWALRRALDEAEGQPIDEDERDLIGLEVGVIRTDAAGVARCIVRAGFPASAAWRTDAGRPAPRPDGGRVLPFPTRVPVRISCLGYTETLTFEFSASSVDGAP